MLFQYSSCTGIRLLGDCKSISPKNPIKWYWEILITPYWKVFIGNFRDPLHYAYSWGCYMQNFSPKCTILGAIICYYYASAIWTYGWNWIKPWSLNLLASHFSQFPLSTHINKCFSVVIKITIVRWVTNKLVGVLDLRREKRRAGSSSIRGPSWNEDWEEIHNLIYF